MQLKSGILQLWMQIQLPVDSVWIWLLVRWIVCKWLFQIQKKRWAIQLVDFPENGLSRNLSNFLKFFEKTDSIGADIHHPISIFFFFLKKKQKWKKSRNHRSFLHIRLFCNIYKNNHQELFWYLKPLFIGSSTHLQPHSYHTRKELELSLNLKNANC